MKKFLLSAAMLLGVSFYAMCEAPEGWETMYFHNGQYEYCATNLEGDLSPMLEIFGDAIVVSFESDSNTKGNFSLKVGDFTVKGTKDEYGTVSFLIKGKETTQMFIDAVGDGTAPITITSGNTTHTVKFSNEAAATFTKAIDWVKKLPNAMNYE